MAVSVGESVRIVRELQGLTQNELARRAKGGGKGDRLGREKGTGYFSVASCRSSAYSLPYASHPSRPSGWPCLPCPQSWQRRRPVFHADGDYRAFLELLAAAKAKHPVKILAFCLMPNHFHLVLQPIHDASLSPFMHWWMTSHVRRYHRYYRSHGHVWQGRFKSFPIQQDGHLLTVLRYVLHNPVRARLVEQAGEWPWSSLRYPQLIAPLSASRSAEMPHGLGPPCLMTTSPPSAPV
ncbi:MAG: transposase [Nitrospira sp.]